MAQDEGFKVVFVGDSVVHGGGVPTENQTIPAYFSQQLSLLMPGKEIKVYNFSLPGCTPEDTYNIVSFIADARPDLVVYDANIGWFGSSREMEHPRLAELAVVETTVSRNNAVETDKSRSDELEDSLTALATDHWSLYRNRIFLNYAWFGKPLKEILQIKKAPEKSEADTSNLLNEEELYKPWYLKNFDVMKKTKGKLGYCSLNDSNSHWIMYNRLLEKLAREKIPTVIFIVPRNRPLYEKYDLLDEKVLKDQQEKIARAARACGAEVYDYTFAVSDRFFVDSVHLTAEGNRDLAERLVWDIVRDKVVK